MVDNEGEQRLIIMSPSASPIEHDTEILIKKDSTMPYNRLCDSRNTNNNLDRMIVQASLDSEHMF